MSKPAAGEAATGADIAHEPEGRSFAGSSCKRLVDPRAPRTEGRTLQTRSRADCPPGLSTLGVTGATRRD